MPTQKELRAQIAALDAKISELEAPLHKVHNLRFLKLKAGHRKALQEFDDRSASQAKVAEKRYLTRQKEVAQQFVGLELRDRLEDLRSDSEIKAAELELESKQQRQVLQAQQGAEVKALQDEHQKQVTEVTAELQAQRIEAGKELEMRTALDNYKGVEPEEELEEEQAEEEVSAPEPKKPKPKKRTPKQKKAVEKPEQVIEKAVADKPLTLKQTKPAPLPEPAKPAKVKPPTPEEKVRQVLSLQSVKGVTVDDIQRITKLTKTNIRSVLDQMLIHSRVVQVDETGRGQPLYRLPSAAPEPEQQQTPAAAPPQAPAPAKPAPSKAKPTTLEDVLQSAAGDMPRQHSKQVLADQQRPLKERLYALGGYDTSVIDPIYNAGHFTDTSVTHNEFLRSVDATFQQYQQGLKSKGDKQRLVKTFESQKKRITESLVPTLRMLAAKGVRVLDVMDRPVDLAKAADFYETHGPALIDALIRQEAPELAPTPSPPVEAEVKQAPAPVPEPQPATLLPPALVPLPTPEERRAKRAARKAPAPEAPAPEVQPEAPAPEPTQATAPKPKKKPKPKKAQPKPRPKKKAQARKPSVPSAPPAKTKPTAGQWWHRGVSGMEFNLPSDDEVKAYEDAEQVVKDYIEAGYPQPKPAKVEQAQATLRTLGRKLKGQMFSQDLGAAQEFAGKGSVFSIQLPPEVAQEFMGQGSRMSAGQYLTIPGDELSRLSKQHPSKHQEVAAALKEFGAAKTRPAKPRTGPTAPKIDFGEGILDELPVGEIVAEQPTADMPMAEVIEEGPPPPEPRLAGGEPQIAEPQIAEPPPKPTTRKPKAKKRPLAKKLATARQKGEGPYFRGEVDPMQPSPYHAFDAAVESVPEKIRSRFQAHGITSKGQDRQLVELLEKGIDPAREFHTGPLVPGVHGVDTTRTQAPYILLSDPDTSLRETGVKHVVVNDAAEANLPALKQNFPGVNFVRSADVPKHLEQLAKAKPSEPQLAPTPPKRTPAKKKPAKAQEQEQDHGPVTGPMEPEESEQKSQLPLPPSGLMDEPAPEQQEEQQEEKKDKKKKSKKGGGKPPRKPPKAPPAAPEPEPEPPEQSKPPTKKEREAAEREERRTQREQTREQRKAAEQKESEERQAQREQARAARKTQEAEEAAQKQQARAEKEQARTARKATEQKEREERRAQKQQSKKEKPEPTEEEKEAKQRAADHASLLRELIHKNKEGRKATGHRGFLQRVLGRVGVEADTLDAGMDVQAGLGGLMRGNFGLGNLVRLASGGHRLYNRFFPATEAAAEGGEASAIAARFATPAEGGEVANAGALARIGAGAAANRAVGAAAAEAAGGGAAAAGGGAGGGGILAALMGGGGAGGAGGGAGGAIAAAFSNPVTAIVAIVAALAALAAALVVLPALLQDFGAKILDQNRKFAEVSGPMAAVFAQVDTQRIQIDMERGGRLAGSADYLGGGQVRLEKSLTDMSVFWQDLKNTVVGGLMNLLATIAEMTQGIWTTLQEALNWIKTKFGLDTTTPNAGVFQDFLGEAARSLRPRLVRPAI